MRVLMVLCALVAAPFVAGVSQGGHDAQQCGSDWHAQHQTHANNGKHLGWAKQVVPCPPPAPQPNPPPNQPPTASFSASCSGLSCGFTDASSDPGGLVASWSWAFGDGGTATTQSVSHAYGAAGTYTVQLTVTDNLGATGTTSQSVTVT